MVLRESVGSARHEAELQFQRETLLLRFEPRDFLLRQHGHFRIGRFALEQGAVVGEVRNRFEVTGARRHEFLEPGVFLREFLRALRIGERLRDRSTRLRPRRSGRETFRCADGNPF